MAFRKAKIKEQFEQVLGPLLEPGERVEVGVLSQSGPTPWMTGAIGILLMLAFGMRYYFVAVTDRRVLFVRASLMTVKPRGLAWADARGTGVVTDVDADASLWSHFRYQRPGEERITRFNVHRIWRDELRTLLSAMTAAGVSLPAPPPIAPA